MSAAKEPRLPDPLPISVRPIAGESVESYIRRLARANHLRPSLLQIYVRDALAPYRAIRPERLAAVSGRTLTALAYALTGLAKTRRQTADSRQARPQEPKAQEVRKARLFKAIRADDARGLSIRRISERHRVHRRMVRQALNSPTAEPPPRKRMNRAAPALDPIRDAIDSLLDQNLTAWEIWTRVVDEHDADASYATVRDYIRTRDDPRSSKIH